MRKVRENIAASTRSTTGFLNGMMTLQLFPDATEVLATLAPSGLQRDWAKVGQDLRRAMIAWRRRHHWGDRALPWPEMAPPIA
ncbi:hypothetical protein K4H01_23110, partial [Mycobacterium tuberculosis]|nr:hypothetical protein [Mycobacterium tuberculosis]